MLFTAHNSGLCLQTLVLTHTAEVSQASQVASGEVSFSSQCHSTVPLSSHQPCYPKPFSLTFNIAFPFALQLSHAFFLCKFCSLSKLPCKKWGKYHMEQIYRVYIHWSHESSFYEQSHHWLFIVVDARVNTLLCITVPLITQVFLTKSLNKCESNW